MKKEMLNDPFYLAKEYQKRIMAKHEEQTFTNNETKPSEFHIGFAKALIDKDYYTLSRRYEIFNGLNHCAVEMFSLVSGIDLNNQSRQKREMTLADWCGYSQDTIQKNDLIMDYLRERRKLLEPYSQTDAEAVVESLKYVARQLENGYVADKIKLDGSKNKKFLLYKHVEGQISYIDFSKKNMSCYQDVVMAMSNAFKYGALKTSQIIDNNIEILPPDKKENIKKSRSLELDM